MSVPNFNNILFLFIIVLFSTCSNENTSYPLSIDQPYGNFPMKGQESIAAYMTLKNISDQVITISGIKCDGVTMSSFHNMRLSEENQMLQMIKEDQIILDLNESIKLKEGGRHLMLMGLKREFFDKEYISCYLALGEDDEFLINIPFK